MIYILIDPETWTIRYVGKTSQSLKSRLNMHVKLSLSRGYLPVNIWIKSLNEKGLTPIIRGLESPGFYTDERKWVEKLSFCDLLNRNLTVRYFPTMPIPEALMGLGATDDRE